jgi:hypothetical protein
MEIFDWTFRLFQSPFLIAAASGATHYTTRQGRSVIVIFIIIKNQQFASDLYRAASGATHYTTRQGRSVIVIFIFIIIKNQQFASDFYRVSTIKRSGSSSQEPCRTTTRR